MTMMENQNAASFDPESFVRKENLELIDSSISFQTNEKDDSSIAFQTNEKDDSSKYKVIDDFSMDNESGTTDYPTKEGQDGQLHLLSGWDKDTDSLSSDSYDDIDKEHGSPENGSSATVAELADYKGNNSRDSSSQCNVTSDFYETDKNLFTDKSVLECEVPELEVCYKEIDCQIPKDICMDEGRPEKDVSVIKSCKDEKSAFSFSQPPNEEDRLDATKDSSLEYTDDLSTNEHEINEIDGKKVVSQGRLGSSLDNSFEKDAAKGCELENSVQAGEADYSATGKAETDSDSPAGTKFSVEDIEEGQKVIQPPDEILDENPIFDSPPASSAEAGGTGGDVKASSLIYNSQVESQSITFNFKSPAPEVVEVTESVNEQPADSEDLPKDMDAENLSGSGGAQCTTNSNDSPPDGLVQIPSNKSGSSQNDVQAVEPNVPQSNSANVSVVSQLQHDVGEASFSAASLITYSGPVALSGSLSHRSDGSTTSGKSFAFPVLQTEWSSSPVRMAKADRRHFRKHKGWRSGLLCCRF